MTEQILRLPEVLAMTGLSRSSLYRRINSGDFPAPILLGGDDSRAVGWRRSEVEAWIESRPRSDEPPQGPAGGSPNHDFRDLRRPSDSHPPPALEHPDP